MRRKWVTFVGLRIFCAEKSYHYNKISSVALTWGLMYWKLKMRYFLGSEIKAFWKVGKIACTIYIFTSRVIVKMSLSFKYIKKNKIFLQLIATKLGSCYVETIHLGKASVSCHFKLNFVALNIGVACTTCFVKNITVDSKLHVSRSSNNKQAER